MSNWHYEWTCLCGQRFIGLKFRHSRFLTFGFGQLCPKCGAVLGDRGPSDQVKREIVQYVPGKRTIPFCWWRPRTWKAPLTRETYAG